MAKFACKCGAQLRDDDPAFSGHLFRYGDYDIEVDSSVLRGRAYEVWGCPVCDRLWIFWQRRYGSYPTEYVRYRPSAYETARLIEAKLGVTLKPSRSPDADWVDERGATYVVVGNFHARYFDQEWLHLQARIRDHLTAVDVVAVDVSGFGPKQRDQVRNFVASLNSAVVLVGG